MRQGVVIYNDWAPLLRRLPDALRGKVFTAILDYSETGVRSETGDPAADMLLAVMYQKIDADGQKYEETCRKNAENVRKRYERIQSNTTEYERIRPNTNVTNQTKTKTKLNNKEKSTLTCTKKESATIVATPTPASRHERFIKWLADNCPYIAGHYKLPSDVLLAKLINTYGAEAVAEECLNIENRTDLRKRYSNLYQTLNNWLKKDYAENKRNNTKEREQRAAGVAALIQRLADEDDQRAASAAIQPNGRA